MSSIKTTVKHMQPKKLDDSQLIRWSNKVLKRRYSFGCKVYVALTHA